MDPNKYKALAKITHGDLGDAMSPLTLRKKVFEGRVPYLKVNGRIFIERAVLETLTRGVLVPARSAGPSGAAA
jgi:hypothetical protein